MQIEFQRFALAREYVEVTTFPKRDAFTEPIETKTTPHQSFFWVSLAGHGWPWPAKASHMAGAGQGRPEAGGQAVIEENQEGKK